MDLRVKEETAKCVRTALIPSEIGLPHQYARAGAALPRGFGSRPLTWSAYCQMELSHGDQMESRAAAGLLSADTH